MLKLYTNLAKMLMNLFAAPTAANTKSEWQLEQEGKIKRGFANNTKKGRGKGQGEAFVALTIWLKFNKLYEMLS